jgi:hypothetical protein
MIINKRIDNLERENMTKDEMQAKIDEYLATVSDSENDEWYTTTRAIHQEGLDGFLKWLYADEIEKENRYAKYLSLKAEFELLQDEFEGNQ